ncbi:hypothetical protein FACS189443_2100 [Planctomycetales bacterium]|nr:hypothetical protein FACS189443_2100 [Planctomycetales bacterium]
MLKKLVKHGNSYALVIERPILEILNINPEDPVRVSTDGKKIMVQKEKVLNDKESEPEMSEEFKISLDKINQRYASVLKRLA